MTNQDVKHLSRDNTPEHSLYDVAWQALHMAAAAACRGITPPSERWHSIYVHAVLNRNTREEKSCTELCAETKKTTHCDGEASIYGKVGEATANGQSVGWFYNYGCDDNEARIWGGNEALDPEKEIMRPDSEMIFSFCCCHA